MCVGYMYCTIIIFVQSYIVTTKSLQARVEIRLVRRKQVEHDMYDIEGVESDKLGL